jgi:hypothetical protein
VNVRASLSLAQHLGIVSDADAAILIGCAKSLFYKDRHWERILTMGRQKAIKERRLQELRDWLPTGQVDVKAEDARELIRTMGEWHPDQTRSKMTEFPDTIYWQELLHRLSREHPLL